MEENQTTILATGTINYNPIIVSGEGVPQKVGASFAIIDDYVLGGKTNGPNVFCNCVSDNSFSVSEPHHRWGNGALYDNVIVKEPNKDGGWFEAVNRGNSGTGHGWSGANITFWNCTSVLTIVGKPPTAQNFAVGIGGLVDKEFVKKCVQRY